MSKDLISRNRLLTMLKYNAAITQDEMGNTRQLIAIDVKKLIDYIEKMPTAFDLDEIVEKLQEEEADALNWTGNYEDYDPYYSGKAEAYGHSLELIQEHLEEKEATDK